MFFDNYKLTKLTTLSDTAREDINRLYDLCQNYDSYEYYFSTVEEDSPDFCIQYDFPVYYLCYDKHLLVGIISILPDNHSEDITLILPYYNSACLYGLIHPDYRRQSLFTKMLKHVINDLCLLGISSVEVHLCDSDDIPPYIDSILTDNGFKLHHHEYLMEYNFSEKRSDSEHQQLCELEVEYDEDEQEFSLWIGDNYVGGSHLYIPDEHIDDVSYNSSQNTVDYATFYGYEILEEYRGKGYGHQGLLLILDMLHSMNFKKMLLHVSGENKKAHNIYTRCGLKVQSSFSVYRLSPKGSNQENKVTDNS